MFQKSETISCLLNNYKVFSISIDKYNKYIYLFEMDKLLCILCRNSYKNPKMCSNCSEIYCNGCI